MARTRSSSSGELIISSSKVEHSMLDTLFWSRRGDVACGSHAPDSDSERWGAEGWCSIPESARSRHGLTYQCPRCAPDGRLHRHIHLTERDTSDLAGSA
jgi:hypothetical protein